MMAKVKVAEGFLCLMCLLAVSNCSIELRCKVGANARGLPLSGVFVVGDARIVRPHAVRARPLCWPHNQLDGVRVAHLCLFRAGCLLLVHLTASFFESLPRTVLIPSSGFGPDHWQWLFSSPLGWRRP